MIKRILIGIGGTPFTATATEAAVQLGVTHGARVTAVTVVDEARLRNVGPIPLGGGAAAAELREHRFRVTREKISAAIASLEQQCAARNVPLTVLREHGDPFRLLTQRARYHDLMIFGLRSMFEYDVLGPDVDPAAMLNSLAKSGVSPILAGSDRRMAVRRVLFAYDGSAPAAQAMREFIRMRLWPEVELRILTCDDPTEDVRQLAEDARDYCRDHGVEPLVAHRPDAAADAILAEAASWNADLVVLGCSGRSSLTCRLFGATALDVLRRADCPLFLSQ